MNERHIHPLTDVEHAEVVLAVKAMIAVLPVGDDDRGQARERLASALTKLEEHWCPWCPVEVRDFGAIAHNAAVNYGTERGRRKMGDLLRAVNRYDVPLDAHFRAVNEFAAKQPVCARLEGCQIRPGGHFHDPECPVEKAARA